MPNTKKIEGALIVTEKGTTTDSVARLMDCTSSDIIPNDSGEIKTKYRVAQKGANAVQDAWVYYKICTLPISNDGNYASVIVSGRMGGWGTDSIGYINAILGNRHAPGISVLNIATPSVTNLNNTYNRTDIVMYQNSDETVTVYLKCGFYWVFDLDFEFFQSSINAQYDGTYSTTTPEGTLVAAASTSTQKVEILNGSLLVNGNSFYNKNKIDELFSKVASNNTFTAYNIFNRPTSNRDYTDADGNVVYTEPYYQTAIDVLESKLRVKHINNLIWSSETGHNQGIEVSRDSFASLPMNNYWHDLFGFGNKFSLNYEITTDGATWNTGTADMKLFNQKMKQSVPILTSSAGTNICGARWTWGITQDNIMYGNGYWLCIGRCWSSEYPTTRFLVEISSDNETWETIIDSTIHYKKGNSNPLYFRSIQLTSKPYLRLTISKDPNTTAYLNLSSIKLLSDRWGDQGQGTELEFPYDWDENKQIILQNNIYPTTSEAYSLGKDNKLFKNIYTKDITAINATLSGNINISGTTTLGSEVTLASTDKPLTVFGPTYLKNTLNLNGSATIIGDTVLDGFVTLPNVGAPLTVFGEAHLKNNTFVTGAVNLVGSNNYTYDTDGTTIISQTPKDNFVIANYINGEIAVQNDLRLIGTRVTAPTTPLTEISLGSYTLDLTTGDLDVINKQALFTYNSFVNDKIKTALSSLDSTVENATEALNSTKINAGDITALRGEIASKYGLHNQADIRRAYFDELDILGASSTSNAQVGQLFCLHYPIIEDNTFTNKECVLNFSSYELYSAADLALTKFIEKYPSLADNTYVPAFLIADNTASAKTYGIVFYYSNNGSVANLAYWYNTSPTIWYNKNKTGTTTNYSSSAPTGLTSNTYMTIFSSACLNTKSTVNTTFNSFLDSFEAPDLELFEILKTNRGLAIGKNIQEYYRCNSINSNGTKEFIKLDNYYLSPNTAPDTMFSTWREHIYLLAGGGDETYASYRSALELTGHSGVRLAEYCGNGSDTNATFHLYNGTITATASKGFVINNVDISKVATASTAGLMAAKDKENLDTVVSDVATLAPKTTSTGKKCLYGEVVDGTLTIVTLD